jgi:hypothetical protein
VAAERKAAVLVVAWEGQEFSSRKGMGGGRRRLAWWADTRTQASKGGGRKNYSGSGGAPAGALNQGPPNQGGAIQAMAAAHAPRRANVGPLAAAGAAHTRCLPACGPSQA